MRLAFIIPYRPSGDIRDEIFDWTTKRIKFFFPGSTIYTGDGGKGEFNRSAAINQAASQIVDEAVMVINDADTVWNPSLIYSGYHALTYDSKFVIPYTTYRALTQESGRMLLDDPVSSVLISNEFNYEFEVDANEYVYHAPPVSGTLMMRTESFHDIGGFDERFVGWGEEDVAFVVRAAQKLSKPFRCSGDVYHIWHPRGKDYDQPHYKQNQRLLRKEYL